MSIADAGLVACVVILLLVVVDWRRGRTAIGKHRLSKEESPDRYWMAIVLYMNMAFGLFWLQGKAHEAEMEQPLPDRPRAVVVFQEEAS